MGNSDASTIERFMAIHPEDRIEYFRNASAGLVGSPPPPESSAPRRNGSRGWAKVVGYSAIVFICGMTLGYGMRDYSQVPAVSALIDAAPDPALLRIDYNLRVR